MKTNTLLFVVFILFSFAGNTQTLSEQLGAVQTDFIITSDSVDLTVTSQQIVKRAENETYINSSHDTGEGYGYGYETFHFEFVASENLQVKPFYGRLGQDRRNRIELKFYNSSNELLTSITLDYRTLNQYSNNDSGTSSTFYSIDIKDVPLVLLDETSTIDIVQWQLKR